MRPVRPTDAPEPPLTDDLSAVAERLLLALESAEAGLYDVDLRSGRCACSARYLEIYGLDPAAPDATDPATHRALIEADDQVAMEAAIVRALETGTTWTCVVRIRRASDGAARFVRIHGRTLTDADGTPIRSIGTVRDVTQEQRDAIALSEGLRQLAEAQRVAGIGSWEWDIASNTVEWSAETYRLLGFDPASTRPSLDRVLEVAYDDAGKAAYLQAVQNALAGDRAYDLETRIRRPDGGVRYFHVRGEVIRATDGTAVRMVGTMEDVTERRADARALAERESLLRTLAESSPVGIFLTDAVGSAVTYANACLLRLWDMPLEEFSRRWQERIHPDDVASLAETRAQLGQRDGPTRLSYRLCVGERVSHIRITMAPVRDVMGGLAGHVGIVEDVTQEVDAIAERERLEAQVRQVQKLESIGVLAGGIAHDFNNLLVGMLANTTQALLELPGDSALRPLLDDVLLATERAADLTRQLLAYAGRGQLVVGTLELSQLVREMQGLFRSIVARRAQFVVDLAEGLALVRGDSTQLRQVIFNLVTNAVEALADEQGLVRLRTFADDGSAVRGATVQFGEVGTRADWIAVEVSDTGRGMDAATLGRIFDPFFTTKFTGRGLGLAATLGIVRSHGGVIAVRTTPDEGATFTMLLPPTEAVVAMPEADAPAPSAPLEGGGMLLVVDDDDMVRRVLVALLGRRGFDVREATNGQEAVEAVAQAPGMFRAVLLDLTMPVLGGEAALRAIRAIAPHLPIVLMSGYSDQTVQDGASSGGVSTVLSKPFTADQVEAAIGRALASTTH